MKYTLQIQITRTAQGIAVRGPYSVDNRTTYKRFGGRYEPSNHRWVLPDNEDSWELLEELFGAKGLVAVAIVEPKHITTIGNEMQMDGYVIAQWDTRRKRVSLPSGVELSLGDWDEIKSASHEAPILTSSDAVFCAVVRRDYALRAGLHIVTVLAEECPNNPLSQYSDFDLRTELEDRGYQVTRARSFF